VVRIRVMAGKKSLMYCLRYEDMLATNARHRPL
jgi:hypothetical protein